MTPQEDAEKRICYRCIGNGYLSVEVEANGTPIKCSYCISAEASISLDDLANRVQCVIEEHFERTPSEPNWMDSILIREGMIDVWLPDGQQVKYLIMDITDTAEEVARDVADILSANYEHRAKKYGDENPYDSETHYEERGPNDSRFRLSWELFCYEIMYKERFFPRSAEPVLGEIFEDLPSLTTYDGTPVVREVTPLDSDFSIWRARTAQSDEELKKILESPDHQLGPPPPGLSEVSRMNPRGVSVFYGAMDPETCVAEVRPPVGSHVVLGKFRLLRAVTLLDLGALSKVFAKPSYFEPTYGFKKAKASFIRHFVTEISRPVMPRDVEREYLPTQFVASYLAHRAEPVLDGIIFPSSQTADDGQNIVLFNSARGVKPYSIPEGSERTVYVDSDLNDEDDDDIFISEIVPSAVPEEDADTQRGQRDYDRTTDYDDTEEHKINVSHTLELDIVSIEVRGIKSVKFDTHSRRVTRHRQTTEERDSLERRISGLVSFDDFGDDF